MYLVRIEHTICAAHALVLRGVRETLHGHNWRVEATLAGSSLDADGHPLAAAGLRFAEDGLFSEIYLDGPAEQVLAAAVGRALAALRAHPLGERAAKPRAFCRMAALRCP